MQKVKATLWERCVAAYYGFVDADRVLLVMQDIAGHMHNIQKKEEELASKHDAALSNLEGYDKALIVSVAGGTANWRDLFGQAMHAIETLPVADQIVIMQYIFRSNRHVVATTEFRQWMTRHAEALIETLPE